VRGFNKNIFFGVALTGKKRVGKYYFYIGKVEGRDASVILSQAKIIDTKRLVRKIGVTDEITFKKVKECLKKTLLG
jgi:mRNA interferase MazF